MCYACYKEYTGQKLRYPTVAIVVRHLMCQIHLIFEGHLEFPTKFPIQDRAGFSGTRGLEDSSNFLYKFCLADFLLYSNTFHTCFIHQYIVIIEYCNNRKSHSYVIILINY